MSYRYEVQGKGGQQAKVVLASLANDIPIYTLELRYHHFIHAEFMTHRVFSRNASSSRAIPTPKILEQVTNEPAIPIYWGKNQSGMQAKEECNSPVLLSDSEGGNWGDLEREEAWKACAREASSFAFSFSEAGYHKQIVNRLVEPFSFIKVVVTATEWDNFFNLRLSKDAQPEIQELARCMREAIEAVAPTKLEYGEWHLPYLTWTEEKFLQNNRNHPSYHVLLENARYISAGRCARVSYDNIHSVKDPVALAKQLYASGHWSPFEHQATPMQMVEDGADTLYPYEWESGVTHMDKKSYLWSGNFRGWIQNRQLLTGE